MSKKVFAQIVEALAEPDLKEIEDYLKDLNENQHPLGPEFEAAIFSDIESLYVTDEAIGG